MKLGYSTFTTIHFGGKYCTSYSLSIHLISLITSYFADRCVRHIRTQILKHFYFTSNWSQSEKKM